MSNDFDALLSEKPSGFDESLESALGERQVATIPPTAIKHDRWSLRRGKQWAKNDVGSVATKKVDDEAERNHLAADMLSVAWEPSPCLNESCSCEGRRDFLKSLMETKEYQSIHRDTALDDMASELAAAAFAKQWFSLVEENQQDGSDSPDGPPGEDDINAQARMQRHIKQAISQAKSDVKDLNDTRDALGIGGDGGSDGSMSTDEIKEIFNSIKDSHTLRRIMELAGKYLRLAQSMQSSKVVHGDDEVVGIELGDDLSNVVPSELVLLADEDLEIDFMRRFIDGALMVDEMRAIEDEARGPLVIVVDESGSMHGERVAHAKAIALAILWIARHQKRWACLVGFAGNTSGNFLVIPPGTQDTQALVDWLGHFYGGGTTMDVPLDTLPSKWEKLGCPLGRTDIIQITDAVVNVPDKMRDKFNAWKESYQVKMNTIVIGSDPGQLDSVSDRLWTIDQLDIESHAVRQCLSV